MMRLVSVVALFVVLCVHFTDALPTNTGSRDGKFFVINLSKMFSGGHSGSHEKNEEKVYGGLTNGGINSYVPYSAYGDAPLYGRLYGHKAPYTPVNPLEPGYYIKRDKNRNMMAPMSNTHTSYGTTYG